MARSLPSPWRDGEVGGGDGVIEGGREGGIERLSDGEKERKREEDG